MGQVTGAIENLALRRLVHKRKAAPREARHHPLGLVLVLAQGNEGRAAGDPPVQHSLAKNFAILSANQIRRPVKPQPL